MLCIFPSPLPRPGVLPDLHIDLGLVGMLLGTVFVATDSMACGQRARKHRRGMTQAADDKSDKAGVRVLKHN